MIPDYDRTAARGRGREEAASEENRKLVEFFSGADILVYDSQYTKDEMENDKLGWGHSSYEFAIEKAFEAGVKKLLLTHHDPERTDEELDILISFYREKYSDINRKMNFSLAVEGREYFL